MRAPARVPQLVGLVVLLGCATPIPAPAIPERAAEAVPLPAPAATSDSAALGPAPAVPAGEVRPDLVAYEVLGPEVSPDRKSWCILNIALKEPVSKSTLRSLWAVLREQQTTEWGRFTCRFYLPDMDSFGASWADVNEITIFEGSPDEPVVRAALPMVPAAEAEIEEKQAVIVERGDDYLIIEISGVEIVTPWPSSRPRPVWFHDPRTEERVRLVDPLDLWNPFR